MDWTRCLVPGLLAAICTSPLSAADTPEKQTLVLKGALIRTQSDAGDFIGSVVIRDGKILSVGRSVPVPAEARVIDVTGCVITPGLIDAHSTLGLNPAAAAEGGREATLNIVDAIDPFSDAWRDAARQGITAAYVQPAGSGTLGGSGAVLRIGPSETAEELVLRSPAGVQMALGRTPTAAPAQPSPVSELFGRRGFTPPTPTTPAPPPVSNSLTRFSQFEQLRGLFDGAKKYGESKPARREQPKDLLLSAIKREIPVRIEVHHEDDLRNALKLAADFTLAPVFERVDRVRLIPDELKTSRAALVVGPFLSEKASSDVRKLALDGRRFAIGTFGDQPGVTAGLRLHAAAAVAAGYPRDRVLRALTSDAAELVGAGQHLGRIEAGRSADLAVFAGDPLDPSAPVRMTISQGRITYSNTTTEVADSSPVAKPDLPESLPASYVIRTTRLLAPNGEFAPGEMYIVNGRLSARGNGAAAPVFDLGNAPVTPGLVSAHVAVAGETAADADAAHLKATDGLPPDDARLRDAGILTTVVAPGSTNVIAGVAGVTRTGESTPATDLGLKLVLSSAARSRDRYPVSLAGQVELLNARLRGAPADTDLHLPPAVRSALLAQRDRALYAVREHQWPAYVEAQTRAEIRAALRLIAEHKLRGVLLMPRDVDDLAEEIRQAGVPVVIGPVKPQDPERITRGLVALGKTGLPIALGGEAADVRASAAWLANAGLPRAAARRALVGQPAEAFGLPQGTGRLSPGDAADFVIWTGDPLDTTAKPAALVVQGQRIKAGSADSATTSVDRSSPATPARSRRRN